VFTSSIAVYGKNQLPMTEELTPKPEDPDGIAKNAVELDLKESQDLFGLNYIIFRPHNVYGERQNISDKYRNVIGIFMNQILQKQPMTIFGNGEQTRAFTYIGNVAPIIAASVERNTAYNQVYNIGADTPYSINHLSREVARAMKAEVKIKYLDARNEVVHAYSTHSKVSSHFGDLIKNVTLEDGLNRMASWVKSQVSRKTTVFNNIEVTKNLPESWR
jgi:UDP-glucose 4-epimerase